MIETGQLQTLLAVANAKSFSKAAEQLHVTQSAISQSIKNLERKVKVKIFKRAGKSVVLTPEGEKLYNLASDYISSMEETMEEILHGKSSMAGKVRIGTLNGVGKSWLAPELLDFAQQYPKLELSITLGFQEDLVKDFENYKLDLLILPEYSLPSTGERVFLSEERSILVFPKCDDFQLDRNLDLETLAKYPTVLFEDGDPLYHKWCRVHFGKGPKKINTRYVVNSHGNMLHAVNAGLGVAVVPTHVWDRSFYRDKVMTLGKDFEVTNYRFFIVYHKGAKELLRIDKTLERLLSCDSPLSPGRSDEK